VASAAALGGNRNGSGGRCRLFAAGATVATHGGSGCVGVGGRPDGGGGVGCTSGVVGYQLRVSTSLYPSYAGYDGSHGMSYVPVHPRVVCCRGSRFCSLVATW
jgi:hypothetical protein